jgi:hypothetical protein
MRNKAQMSLKIRVRTSGAPLGSPLRRGYRIRPTSFVFSILFHVAVVTGLVLLPQSPTADPERAAERPVYDQLIKPEEKKIVWYSPPPAKLPDVTAERRIGTFPLPRAPKKATVAIIATAPQPKSVKQFIWQPVPKIQLRQDLPAPNLIARAAMAIPAPPPPIKQFKLIDKPKARGVQSPVPNISLPVPNGDVSKAARLDMRPVELLTSKTFVAPPPSERTSRAVIPVETSTLALPNVNITGPPPARGLLPEGIGAPSLENGAPPPPNAPPGPANQAGNGKVDIAVVGLHPSDKGQVPDGSRPGQFAQAPNVGEVATGAVKGGIGVPNLTIREGGKVAPPHVDEPRKVLLYADRLRSLPVSTLSVPLHPSTRSLPASIESRFPGRSVYTMVIPIENIPEYSSDWIIWFAAHNGPADAAALNVRAPIPLRKFEPVEPVPPGARTDLRVQIAGVITKEGKLEVRQLLRDLTPAIESAVIRDIQSWEFKPATQDGSPVDIDVVLEIPFSLPPQLAKSEASK